MMSDKTKILCVVAIALTASGCGSGSGDSDSVITDPQVFIDDAVSAVDTTEVTDNVDTSIGVATPVQPASSMQMDAYIYNPLMTAIPAELYEGTSVTLVSNFVANPLMQ